MSGTHYTESSPAAGLPQQVRKISLYGDDHPCSRTIGHAAVLEGPCCATRLQLCSMKTNIGNCIETSGIASLIKTFHSIRHGR